MWYVLQLWSAPTRWVNLVDASPKIYNSYSYTVLYCPHTNQNAWCVYAHSKCSNNEHTAHILWLASNVERLHRCNKPKASNHLTFNRQQWMKIFQKNGKTFWTPAQRTQRPRLAKKIGKLGAYCQNYVKIAMIVRICYTCTANLANMCGSSTNLTNI